MMKKIYRVEHSSLGIGPLCGEGCKIHGQSWFSLANKHTDFTTYQFEQNTFETQDFIPTEQFHKFGCISFGRILLLFKKGSLKMLKEYNFNLYEFEIKDYYEFDGQVMFDSRTAIRGKVIL